MKTKIMLDLETLGNRPGSVIVAIGAVKFGNGEIFDEFYTRIDPESCVKIGLEMDPATVIWWLKQADAPRLEITKPGKPISAALSEFSAWVADPDAEIWGNGATFDNAVLAAAYHQADQKPPWKFWNDRCYRTIKNLHPDVEMQRQGHHHHALDDARAQALHLCDCLNVSIEMEMRHTAAIVDEANALRCTNEALQLSFDLRWKADQRAIKRWQAAHPGNDLTWPDHADLLVWLMQQIDSGNA